MPNKDLIDECQMFLVPASILFAAIGIAGTEPLKALLSVMGVAISVIWYSRGSVWTTEADRRTAHGLAGIFGVAGFISAGVHLYRWLWLGITPISN
jgi:hypothetical protein